jgi:hypothetical protein
MDCCLRRKRYSKSCCRRIEQGSIQVDAGSRESSQAVADNGDCLRLPQELIMNRTNRFSDASLAGVANPPKEFLA